MSVTHKKPVFSDPRGLIIDVLDKEPVNSVTIVTFKKGAVRGNHYHKKTVQFAYLLSGSLKLVTQFDGGPLRRCRLRPGDLVTTPPGEKHAFLALADSVLVVCSQGQRAGKDYEKDTYRLREPLVKSSQNASRQTRRAPRGAAQGASILFRRKRK